MTAYLADLGRNITNITNYQFLANKARDETMMMSSMNWTIMPQ